ncbi:hypothetical protein AB6A40_006940 [Gnathostoma spinigerum]|uniref:Actin interacting protein 3-like C-terminal domain-containing protein n=1 Tax=Gnathostoma spinigerum TaxID=75299 RepID=A0ABD6ES00_9BILA
MSSLPSSAEPSLPDTASVNDETLHQLQKLRRQVMDAQSQIRSIRRNVQMNAQSSRDILHDAFNQIRRLIEEHSLGAATATKKASNIMDKLKADHTEQLVCLQQSLQSFEEDVEEVRKLVLNTNRKLRMSEVEAFTAALTKIGRNAARLKTSFPSLQRELESKIRTDMEDVLRTEKFVKHESAQIDDCLRRCKTLANMMVTMKKLAMVQDPGLTAYRNDRTEKILNDDGMQKPNNISVSERALPVRDTVIRDIQNSEEAEVSQTEPPPVPPSPTNYQAPSTSQKKDDSHVLDSLLDELTVSPSREKSVSPSSVKSERISRSVPPKPPERYSTFDARRRYTPSIVQEFRRQAMSTPVDGPLVVTSTIYKRPQMTTATAANSTIRMPPVAISTTDAIDDETTKTVNASSSDSVNSQEGNRVRSIIMIERQQHSAQQQQQQREMQNHTLQKKPASVA